MKKCHFKCPKFKQRKNFQQLYLASSNKTWDSYHLANVGELDFSFEIKEASWTQIFVPVYMLLPIAVFIFRFELIFFILASRENFQKIVLHWEDAPLEDYFCDVGYSNKRDPWRCHWQGAVWEQLLQLIFLVHGKYYDWLQLYQLLSSSEAEEQAHDKSKWRAIKVWEWDVKSTD